MAVAGRQKKCAREPGAKAYSTRYSQAVSHPSTNQARPCLASEIRRDRARSGWYGRRRWRPLQKASRACCGSRRRSSRAEGRVAGGGSGAGPQGAGPGAGASLACQDPPGRAQPCPGHPGHTPSGQTWSPGARVLGDMRAPRGSRGAGWGPAARPMPRPGVGWWGWGGWGPTPRPPLSTWLQPERAPGAPTASAPSSGTHPPHPPTTTTFTPPVARRRFAAAGLARARARVRALAPGAREPGAGGARAPPTGTARP